MVRKVSQPGWLRLAALSGLALLAGCSNTVARDFNALAEENFKHGCSESKGYCTCVWDTLVAANKKGTLSWDDFVAYDNAQAEKGAAAQVPKWLRRAVDDCSDKLTSGSKESVGGTDTTTTTKPAGG